MVDAAIVMIENAHKRLEEWEHQHPGEKLSNDTRWKIITEASVEVGPALFISLLIITLSFIPIFTLEGQEGKLFGPLAFTKTWSMAGAALLAIVAIPILMGFWIRGRIPAESSNPLNRFFDPHLSPAAAEGPALAEDYPADCAPVDPDGCLAA